MPQQTAFLPLMSVKHCFVVFFSRWLLLAKAVVVVTSWSFHRHFGQGLLETLCSYLEKAQVFLQALPNMILPPHLKTIIICQLNLRCDIWCYLTYQFNLYIVNLQSARSCFVCVCVYLMLTILTCSKQFRSDLCCHCIHWENQFPHKTTFSPALQCLPTYVADSRSKVHVCIHIEKRSCAHWGSVYRSHRLRIHL